MLNQLVIELLRERRTQTRLVSYSIVMIGSNVILISLDSKTCNQQTKVDLHYSEYSGWSSCCCCCCYYYYYCYCFISKQQLKKQNFAEFIDKCTLHFYKCEIILIIIVCWFVCLFVCCIISILQVLYNCGWAWKHVGDNGRG